MAALHSNEYVTLTFVVRAGDYDPVDPDDPREMLTDDDTMFWAAETGITDVAVGLGADPALWHVEAEDPVHCTDCTYLAIDIDDLAEHRGLNHREVPDD